MQYVQYFDIIMIEWLGFKIKILIYAICTIFRYYYDRMASLKN